MYVCMTEFAYVNCLGVCLRAYVCVRVCVCALV